MKQVLIGRVIGAACGLIAAILILTIGFWKTLLIAALVAVGWFVAGSSVVKQSVLDFFSRIFGIGR